MASSQMTPDLSALQLQANTPKAQPHSPLQKHISDIFRGGYFNLSLPNDSAKGKRKRTITFAGVGTAHSPKRSFSRSRAKSPKPFPRDIPTTAKGRRIHESPISAIELERPTKRRRIESLDTSQEYTGSMAIMRGKQPKLLIINPNTSVDMTNGMARLVRDTYSTQGGSNIQIELYTALEGPGSIDNEVHAMESARCVIDDLVVSDRLSEYDAFLVACYSVHPLVGFIRGELEKAGTRAHVMGIFEASVLTALSILPPSSHNGRFGIVSTGKYWEKSLSDGVADFLGTGSTTKNTRFAAVSTTGLNAEQLHSMPKKEVEDRMKKAVRSLMEENGDVSVIILGCAGMAGLDDVVREALVEKYGEKVGNNMHILDGVKCGIGMLENLLRTIPLGREK
ncbi:dcg1 [Hyphodiscus hymeniophilus]|uniref:Dcg1 n=1 Tax=Hyphodiscus hymeniophilus TaxID=353542 RepID=A0A9P6VR18_9HELO|nr:dcg1 [Hyphodiscus hymeniophilus]